jgi:hypothetical protein
MLMREMAEILHHNNFIWNSVIPTGVESNSLA